MEDKGQSVPRYIHSSHTAKQGWLSIYMVLFFYDLNQSGLIVPKIYTPPPSLSQVIKFSLWLIICKSLPTGNKNIKTLYIF